jgi:DNA primase
MANEIEEVKQRLDLVDLVGQYVALKKAGANYKATCPFHQEKTASLMVSPEKQIWKCFGCSRGGDHFAFIMEAEHLEFGDALKLLAQKAGVTLQPKTRSEYQTKDRKETLYAINQFSSLVFHKVLLESSSAKTAREYLAKRKISDQMIKTFRLGFASPSVNLKDFLMKRNYTPADIAKAGSPERFRDRIIFPIFDVLGNVVGFTGRALGDIEPKYLNSPETPTYNKGRILYGLNLAKGFIKEHDYVILVEGQMDVISLYQAGIRNVVASSGTAFTESQVTTLSKYTQNFLLAFDNDTAGQTMTRKVIELLLKFDLSSKIIDFGKFKDAGELFENDPKMWREVAKAAKEGLDWWLAGEITTAGNLNFIENKKKVVRAMLPVLKLVAEQPAWITTFNA